MSIYYAGYSNPSSLLKINQADGAISATFTADMYVSGICQDLDGNIWTVTETGIVTRFSASDPSQRSLFYCSASALASICVDKFGNIWVTYGTGADKIAKFDKANSYTMTEYASPYQPCAICSDPDGNIFVQGRGGLIAKYSFADSYARTDYNSQSSGTGIACDKSGNIYAITYSSKLVRHRKDNSYTAETYSLPGEAYGIAIDQDENIFIAAYYANQLYKFDKAMMTRTDIPAPVLSPYGLSVDSDGSIWATGYSGYNYSKFDKANGYYQTKFTYSWNLKCIGDATGQIPVILGFSSTPAQTKKKNNYIISFL